MENTFKQIIGGKDNTPEEVYQKFSWLRGAVFSDAVCGKTAYGNAADGKTAQPLRRRKKNPQPLKR